MVILVIKTVAPTPSNYLQQWDGHSLFKRLRPRLFLVGRRTDFEDLRDVPRNLL